jgi:acyl carrier protein
MSLIEEVTGIVNSSLQLGNHGIGADRAVMLLGSLPELDSMAVVTLITALEDHYDIVVDDDELSAETFETLGSLTDFVSAKVNGG